MVGGQEIHQKGKKKTTKEPNFISHMPPFSKHESIRIPLKGVRPKKRTSCKLSLILLLKTYPCTALFGD